MKRRTEITIETERIIVLESVGRDDAAQWCDKCDAQTRLIAPDLAGALLRVNTQTILRWAEAARLHFADTADAAPLLCLGPQSSTELCPDATLRPTPQEPG